MSAPALVLSMGGAQGKFFAYGAISWIIGVVSKVAILAGVESLWLKRWRPGSHAVAAGLISAFAELIPAAAFLTGGYIAVRDVLAFGVGAGGLEALFVMVLALRKLSDATSVSEKQPSPTADALLLLSERTLALIGHVASRCLVYVAMSQGSIVAGSAAVVLFALVDGVADYGNKVGWDWESARVRLRYYALIAVVGGFEVWLAWALLMRNTSA